MSSQGKICVAGAPTARCGPLTRTLHARHVTVGARQPRYPCRFGANRRLDRRLCVTISRWLCPCSTVAILRRQGEMTYRTGPHPYAVDGGKVVKADRETASGEVLVGSSKRGAKNDGERRHRPFGVANSPSNCQSLRRKRSAFFFHTFRGTKRYSGHAKPRCLTRRVQAVTKCRS